MLATFPTEAWQNAVWGGRLAAVPYPTDGPFPWALFYRKDLIDKLGVAPPKTIDELYEFGKKMTKTDKGVWAFGDIFHMVQMYLQVSGRADGLAQEAGRRARAQVRDAGVQAGARVHAAPPREGLVHPDIMASKGADSKTLFNGGKMLMMQDGMGAWRGTQGEQVKVTPDFNIQPVPIFSAAGGDPLAWTEDEPIFYTFVKKGLGKERVEEMLRVLNWCAAPFGTEEDQLREYGVEGKHFTRGADDSPVQTELGRKEIGNQYYFLGGRVPAVVGTADARTTSRICSRTPRDLQVSGNGPVRGLKLEFPPVYSKTIQTTEDKITDVVRGRRPVSDLDPIVKEWRTAGGDEGRAFFEKALADNGR